MKFTHAQITDVRRLRRAGERVAAICSLFPQHTRDEMIEAIDATMRCDTDTEALAHVNTILAGQASGEQFINGRVAWKVTVDRGRVRYAPAF